MEFCFQYSWLVDRPRAVFFLNNFRSQKFVLYTSKYSKCLWNGFVLCHLACFGKIWIFNLRTQGWLVFCVYKILSWKRYMFPSPTLIKKAFIWEHKNNVCCVNDILVEGLASHPGTFPSNVIVNTIVLSSLQWDNDLSFNLLYPEQLWL